MKAQLSSNEDEDYDDSSTTTTPAVYCWWRSADMFDECMKLRNSLPCISSLTPRLMVLREMERLAMVATEGLDELRHKLFTYRSGDFWVPTGGISKEEMDIPAMNTILLVGFSGSGKSSLVNLMYSVLGRSGLIPFAQTSSRNSPNYTTMFMEEHNVLRSMKSGFCAYDSRGFDYEHMGQNIEELCDWMNDGVYHNQLCWRPGDQALVEDEMEQVYASRSSSKFVKRTVNCTLVVVNIAEVYKAVKAGDLKPLTATRELFYSAALRKCNENPILVLTHGDLLSTEERIEGRIKICQYIGISETTGVYDIVCLTEYGFLAEQSDPVTAYALTEAVYRALLISDRSHVPKQSPRDWALLILSWLAFFFSGIFGCLAELCSKLGQLGQRKGGIRR